MAESERMATAEVVAKTLISEHADFLREAVALVACEMMANEITDEIGAARGEVSRERQTHRNGYRPCCCVVRTSHALGLNGDQFRATLRWRWTGTPRCAQRTQRAGRAQRAQGNGAQVIRLNLGLEHRAT